MFKKDKIFYSACGLTIVGISLALMEKELALLFFVGAYLLRPSLHEFGLAKQYADERQLIIHSRSGNIAFIITILALVGYALLRVAQGKTGEELYEIIFIGLSARALTGLVMVGDFRKAGVIIISAIGVLFSIFIILEGNSSLTSIIIGGALALIIIGVGQIARKFPVAIALILSVIVISIIFFAELYEFRKIQTSLWLFFVAPLVTATLCLFFGRGNLDDTVSSKTRSVAFGLLGVSIALVFTLLILFGGKEEPSAEARVITKGDVKEIQGISCTGLVTYFNDGKLESFILAREDTFSGQIIPAGSGVTLTKEGILNYCSLPKDTYIQGHLCKGEGPTSWQTCFYPNGKLKLIWLGQDEVIQGIPCKEASFMADVFGGGAGVSFHENGKLKRCKLPKSVTVEGYSFKKGDHVNFGQDGDVIPPK